MSHTVTIKLIADQEIEIQGIRVNIHELQSILVNGTGVIVCAEVKTHQPQTKWLETGFLSRMRGIEL